MCVIHGTTAIQFLAILKQHSQQPRTAGHCVYTVYPRLRHTT